MKRPRGVLALPLLLLGGFLVLCGMSALFLAYCVAGVEDPWGHVQVMFRSVV